jgi:hypothetical protein
VSQSDRSNDVYGAAAVSPLGERLCSIVYRSRAVSELSDYDLYELVQAAQSRNAAEAITGLMLYDDGRFYQWLEGPADSVKRVMHSIYNDSRHRDVEILSDKPAATRQFGDWKMRLATRGVRSIHSLHNVVVPSNWTTSRSIRTMRRTCWPVLASATRRHLPPRPTCLWPARPATC